MVGLPHSGIEERKGWAIVELLRNLDGSLVRGERQLRLPEVALRDGEIDEPSEKERRIDQDPVVAGLHAFAKEASRLLVGVGAHVRRGEH